MSHPLARLLSVVAVGVILAACGEDSAPKVEATGEGSGAALYAANSASCHGAELQGTDQGPSHLSVVYEPGHHTDDSFRAAIRNGAPQHHWEFGPMPPIDGLDADEVDAIIDFVRSEQERQGLER